MGGIRKRITEAKEELVKAQTKQKESPSPDHAAAVHIREGILKLEQWRNFEALDEFAKALEVLNTK